MYTHTQKPKSELGFTKITISYKINKKLHCLSVIISY